METTDIIWKAMTTIEARKILKRFQEWRRYDGPLEQTPTQPEPKEIGEAIDVAIANLPEDPEPYRPQVQKRVEYILACLSSQLDGFNPFCERRRVQKYTLWRYAVWHKLRMEGYSCVMIGRATGYDHSTVFWGNRRFCDWLEVGDYTVIKVWKELEDILTEGLPRYVGD